jgi:hypothetical protein
MRNLMSFGDPQGKEAKGTRVVRMDQVQAGNHLGRSTAVRYTHPHPWVKEESQGRKAIDTWLIFVPTGISWSKYVHLMSFPGKFPLHHPYHGNNTIYVGKECVGEKTNFHKDATANAHRILFELLSYNIIQSLRF